MRARGGDNERGAQYQHVARVLVVEDDPLNRIVYELVFADQGHELRMVTSVEEAMAVVNDWVPDVAFLDIHLGGESGLDLARRLRSHSHTRRTRLVACTAFVDTYTLQEVLDAGCDTQVEKIIDFAAFRERILEEAAHGRH